MGKMGGSPLAGLAALGLGGLNSTNTGGLNPAGEGSEGFTAVTAIFEYDVTVAPKT